MTNQEAIDTIKTAIGQVEWDYPMDYAAAFDMAVEALAKDNNVPGNGWISVKDRLPDQAGYECLVCAVNENYNQTHVFTAFTGYGEPGWWTGNVHYMARVKSPQDNRVHPALKITHWMPLPTPPEEKCNDD